MRYLGIDPGTTIIGYGVIDMKGSSPLCITYGTIRNAGKDSQAEKVATEKALQEIIQTYTPDAAAVEKLFFFNNKKSAMAVSEMRGVLMAGLAKANIPVTELTPMQVKQQICGHGSAKKQQMQKMMRLLLHLQEDIKPDDAADALALALCCATNPQLY